MSKELQTQSHQALVTFSPEFASGQDMSEHGISVLGLNYIVTPSMKERYASWLGQLDPNKVYKFEDGEAGYSPFSYDSLSHFSAENKSLAMTHPVEKVGGEGFEYYDGRMLRQESVNRSFVLSDAINNGTFRDLTQSDKSLKFKTKQCVFETSLPSPLSRGYKIADAVYILSNAAPGYCIPSQSLMGVKKSEIRYKASASKSQVRVLLIEDNVLSIHVFATDEILNLPKPGKYNPRIKFLANDLPVLFN